MRQNEVSSCAAGGIGRARNYQLDNLKCLLIFAVVLGHMLELYMGKDSGNRILYLVIYSFHMPLFAFVSGVFARYNPDKIKKNMIYPYLVFQTLYVIFANQVLEKDADMQYTTPYWLLWYLFAIIVWPVCSSALMIRRDIICRPPGLWSFSLISCWAYIIKN